MNIIPLRNWQCSLVTLLAWLVPCSPLACAEECPPWVEVCGNGGICNGYDACSGSHTFAIVDGKVEAGKVRAAYADSTALFRYTDKTGEVEKKLPADAVSVSALATCFQLASVHCVGHPYERKGVENQAIKGKLEGFFPVSGDFLVREADQLTRIPQKELSKPSVRWESRPLTSSIQELVQKSAANESLRVQDFLQTWRKPARKVPKKQDWQGCRNPKLFDRLVQLPLNPRCAPKTLYSWGSWDKVRFFQENLGAGPWSKDLAPHPETPLVLTRSAIATYGFGSYNNSSGYAIRVQLKPEVRFKLFSVNAGQPNCAQVPPEEAKQTVYIRVLGGRDYARLSWGDYAAEDYMLCSSDVIHSWSFGTREFYDEIVGEVKKYLNPATQNDWISYVEYRAPSEKQFKPVLTGLNADWHPFTQAQLIATFKAQLKLASQQEGRIYYNPDLPKKKRRHF